MIINDDDDQDASKIFKFEDSEMSEDVALLDTINDSKSIQNKSQLSTSGHRKNQLAVKRSESGGGKGKTDNTSPFFGQVPQPAVSKRQYQKILSVFGK